MKSQMTVAPENQDGIFSYFDSAASVHTLCDGNLSTRHFKGVLYVKWDIGLGYGKEKSACGVNDGREVKV